MLARSEVERGRLSASLDAGACYSVTPVVFKSRKTLKWWDQQGCDADRGGEKDIAFKICQQNAGFEYLQFQCPALQMFCCFLVVLAESHFVAIRSANL
jgi:hypothetical protein